MKIKYISYSRAIGMILIVLCHLMSYIGVNFLAQIFNVGIQLFLFISGYLYGNKKIDEYKIWFWNRIKKIMVPYYIFVITIIVLSKNSGGLISDLMFLLNLQGIAFLFDFWTPNLNYSGLTHLWFITVIMICYGFTILLKKRNFTISKKGDFIKFILIGSLVTIILFFFGINIDYIFIYFIGYFYAQYNKEISMKNFSFYSIIVFISLFIRFIGKVYFDGTILYDHIIVGFTMGILAIWIFLLILKIYKQIERFSLLDKVLIFADKLSYYVYIVHYIFLFGMFNVNQYSEHLFVQIILFIILTLLTSTLLRYTESKLKYFI